MDDFVDIYCERVAPGFWAEPLNALTNISFFIAAFFAYQLARKYNGLDGRSGTLIFLLLCIGTGSFLFHTFATDAMQLADVIPILLYQVAFIVLYSNRVMRAPQKATQALVVMFFFLVFATHQIPDDVLNGSVAYLPALLFLTRFAFWHRKNATRESGILLLAAGTFLLSLTFRSLDMQFCPQIPLGLHFLWHILNGFLLYLTARAYILNARA